VVQVGVKVVDSDSVDTKDLHEGGIAKTVVLVAEGVLALGRVIASSTTGLVVNTNDLESVAALGVDEVPALDLEGIDGSCQGGRDGGEEAEGARELDSERKTHG